MVAVQIVERVAPLDLNAKAAEPELGGEILFLRSHNGPYSASKCWFTTQNSLISDQHDSRLNARSEALLSPAESASYSQL